MFAVNSDPDWSAGKAACLDGWDVHAPAEPPQGFREGKRERRERVDLALNICAGCPMLDDCRTWTFRNRPHGTVSGGMDLTGEKPATEISIAAEAAIHWGRIERIVEAAGIDLTEYQRQYLDAHLQERPEAWQHGGSRPLALRAQCDWILDHPQVGFRRAA